jgi:hypothetical protein
MLIPLESLPLFLLPLDVVDFDDGVLELHRSAHDVDGLFLLPSQ